MIIIYLKQGCSSHDSSTFYYLLSSAITSKAEILNRGEKGSQTLLRIKKIKLRVPETQNYTHSFRQDHPRTLAEFSLLPGETGLISQISLISKQKSSETELRAWGGALLLWFGCGCSQGFTSCVESLVPKRGDTGRWWGTFKRWSLTEGHQGHCHWKGPSSSQVVLLGPWLVLGRRLSRKRRLAPPCPLASCGVM